MTKNLPINADHEIIISGAGPVGLSLAIALSELDFNCMVMCKEGEFEPQKGDFDGRAYTITPACWQMWRSFGITELLEPFVQPVLKVEAEAASFAPLSFDLEDAGEEGEPLGYLVEAHAILASLWKKAKAAPNLTIKTHQNLRGIETHSDRAILHIEGEKEEYACKLLVGCDGRESFVRKSVGIKYPGHDYGAKGIVATIKLDQPHNGVARQIFLQGGPFAVLPLKNNMASLVWTERSAVADSLMALNDRDFGLELREKTGDFLGEFTMHSARFAYPLKMRVADSFVSERVALAGDAAHAVHPLAGQGLNLGLKDVATLAEVIAKAAHVGLDIGSPLALEPYEEWRRADTVSMAAGVDILDKLFKAPAPLRGLAGFGMSSLGKSDKVRSILSKEISGAEGSQTPQLLKGEAIRF